MGDFKDYINGTSPEWSPDLEYGVMEDIETGHGISVRQTKPGQRPVFAMIPFCVYAYMPSHKHRWGTETSELHDVYPFVELLYENGDPVDPRTANINLPSHIIKDKNKLVSIAFNHFKSNLNHFYMLSKPQQEEMKQRCQNKVETYLRDHPEDPELHPHDPEYDDN